MKELLQRDQGLEGEGIAEPREAIAFDRVREERYTEMLRQLPRKVHSDQLY